MPDRWSELLDCLELRPANSPPDGGDTLTAFTGPGQQLGYHRVFGGLLLAQFARAAQLTCPRKALKSLHVLFARAGRTDEPMRYETRLLHEGSTFAALSSVAVQPSGTAACASVSLHSPEDGADLQASADTGPLLPESHRTDLDLLPWDTRLSADLDSREAGPAELDLWMRTPRADPALAPALLAYATDLTLIGTALRPLDGVGQSDAGAAFTSAVTSHTVWFHRPLRTDAWLLLRQRAPLLSGGRCHGRGDVFTEDGTMVASYAQEAMVRLKPGTR